MNNKVGRPLRWKTRDELIGEINEYFTATEFNEYSITGLVLALNASKQLLLDYEKRPEFADIIKEAKLIVEHSYELSLRKHGRSGDIFALKNFGWIDKQEVAHSGELKVSWADFVKDHYKDKEV